MVNAGIDKYTSPMKCCGVEGIFVELPYHPWD